MSKLTKAQAKAHAEACRILGQDALSEDDRDFVLQHWQESANHINSTAGAFFTPPMLARDFAIEVGGHRIIDLCAGIGTLARAVLDRYPNGPSVVCVELNPDYAAVGRKIVPEAQWIVADVFDLPEDIGTFDWAISNPPFGAIKRGGKSAPRYQGKSCELHVIDIASDLAQLGTFIVPQASAPFRYSGEREYSEARDESYLAFVARTGIELEANCGIDCSYHQGAWHGVAPTVEIVIADFDEARQRRKAQSAPQADLFGVAA